MVDVSIKIGDKVFLRLIRLFQPTFRFWQNQQLQSFIESTLQSDGSIITQVSADVLVANKTGQQIRLVAAYLEKPKLGDIHSCIFMPEYIPARSTLPVRVLIFIKKKLKEKGDVDVALCLEDNNGRKQRAKLKLRRPEKPSVF